MIERLDLQGTPRRYARALLCHGVQCPFDRNVQLTLTLATDEQGIKQIGYCLENAGTYRVAFVLDVDPAIHERDTLNSQFAVLIDHARTRYRHLSLCGNRLSST